MKQLSRLRQNECLRNMVASTFLHSDKIIYPIFLVAGNRQKQEIPSLIDQYRYSVDMLLEDIPKFIETGIKRFLLFEQVESSQKDVTGSFAGSSSSVIIKAINAIKKQFPDVILFTDTCLCAYTSHGHCGLLHEDGTIQLEQTLKRLSELAVSYAHAGSDGIAPSAMMDQQVISIRNALDDHQLLSTLIMSYSTKFSSQLYAPFREAVSSSPAFGDRKSYQTDYRNANLAIMESTVDEQEGADILMIKPALFYLDILHQIKQQTRLPVAAYQVSGEYAMIMNQFNTNREQAYLVAIESLSAIFRAGADIVITYWGNQWNKINSLLDY